MSVFLYDVVGNPWLYYKIFYAEGFTDSVYFMINGIKMFHL